MDHSKQMKRVVWVIDALENQSALVSSVSKALSALQGRGLLDIEPVCIVNREYELRSARASGKPTALQVESADLYAPAHDSLRALAISGLRPLHLVEEKSNAVKSKVNALVRYAVETCSDLIAVATHARSGVDRFLLGSFAEELFLQSPLPVLICHSETVPQTSFHKVLVPTDLTQESKVVWDRTLDLLGPYQPDLMLFHLWGPVPMVGPPPFGMPIPFDSPGIPAVLKEEAERWVAASRDRGLNAEFQWKELRTGIADSILETAASKGTNLIVLTAFGGKMRTALLGSTTRQVIRHASCPTLVYRAV